MDLLLDRVTSQAMSFAIRSGISITTTYAIKQCTRLLREAPRGVEHAELVRLQIRLESKIRIISPAIDMIELIATRGNTSLESAVTLTKMIRQQIQDLGARFSQAAAEEEQRHKSHSKKKADPATLAELEMINEDIKSLLSQIEDAIPLINLAITTSGVNLSTKLSGTISPSRLLQASAFLAAADTAYTADPDVVQQVGPTYTLSVYMLFGGHAWRPVDESGVREMTWKEVVHKARVKLLRVPLEKLYELPGESTREPIRHNFIPGDTKAAEFAYQLLIIEDLDDDRVHTFENGDKPIQFDDVSNAGIRDCIPIHEISKIFYADTGKILNIGGDDDSYNPALLLRRDVHAEPPRRMFERSQSSMHHAYDDLFNENGNDGKLDQQSKKNAPADFESASTASTETSKLSTVWRFPADLDPEWVAFEVYAEEPESESDSDEFEHRPKQKLVPKRGSTDSDIAAALSTTHLNHRNPKSASSPAREAFQPSEQPSGSGQLSSGYPPIKTTLSLLEMLLKLTALQQYRQESHLAIEDEMLNFFLEDSATAGAGANRKLRQRIRQDAAKRVGFDPYDESPVKRRGEQYIINTRATTPSKTDEVPKFKIDLSESALWDGRTRQHPEEAPSPFPFSSPQVGSISPPIQQTTPFSSPPRPAYVRRDSAPAKVEQSSSSLHPTPLAWLSSVSSPSPEVTEQDDRNQQG